MEKSIQRIMGAVAVVKRGKENIKWDQPAWSSSNHRSPLYDAIFFLVRCIVENLKVNMLEIYFGVYFG